MKILLKFTKKWGLLLLLLLMTFIIFYFRLYDYLTLATFKHYQKLAQYWTETRYIETVFIYILTFTLLIACTIPCATLFTVIGGFLFGFVALFYAIFATTLGGLILYFAVKTAIGSKIRLRSQSWIKILEGGFQKNAFNYILLLRLVPIFPCWISNISAGALNVKLKTFISATVLGVTPSTFIYVLAGRSLDRFISQDQINFLMILKPEFLLPFLGLVLLSLFPIFYKMVKKYRTKDD